MLNLILLGLSRSGKGSTGNSILGEKVFSVSNNTGLDSKSLIFKKTDPTKNISIIDGLDVMACSEETCLDYLVQELQLSEEGLTAFLFVVNHGRRLTAEHSEVVEMTRKIFGNDVFKKFGICVLTCGDLYKEEGQPKKVKKWFQEQKGELGDLYKECNKRCVLFDNRTKDDKEKNKQIKKLTEIVSQISKDNQRNYGLDDFEEAKPQRESLTMLNKLREKKSKCDAFIEDMLTQMNEAVLNKDEAVLRSVQDKLENFFNDFKKRFATKSTNVDDIIIKLQNAICDVEHKTKTLQVMSFVNQHDSNATSTVSKGEHSANAFDNWIKDDKEKKRQIKKLTEISKDKQRNYGLEDFAEAKPQRESLTMLNKFLEKKSECDALIEDMLAQMNEAVLNKDEAVLRSVQGKLENYLNNFKKHFDTKSTHVDDIIIKLQNAISDVEHKVKTLQKTRFVKQQDSNATAANHTRKFGTIAQYPNQGNTGNETAPKKSIYQNVNDAENEIWVYENRLISLYESFLSDSNKDESKASEIDTKLQLLKQYKKPKLLYELTETTIK